MKKKYLEEIIAQDYVKWIEDRRTVLIQAPTGIGKTYFALHILMMYCLENELQMVWLGNRAILKAQVRITELKVLLQYCEEIGVLRILSYQDLEQTGPQVDERISYLLSADIVVADEVHYFLSDSDFNPKSEISQSWVFRMISNTCLILMTATPDEFKILLDEYKVAENERRENEYRRQVDLTEQRNQDYLLGDDDRDALDTFYEALVYKDNLSEVDEMIELEKPPELELFDYIEIKIKPDYSYVDLSFYDGRFTTKKDTTGNANECSQLHDLIIGGNKNEKWIIFVGTKEKGKKLEDMLNETFSSEDSEKTKHKRNAVFIMSGYENDPTMSEVVEEIVKKESFPCTVLICTTVLDNGVTISDPAVKNMAIDGGFFETEFKQCLGRKRVSEGERLKLYVNKCSTDHFSRIENECFQNFCELFPVLGKDDVFVNWEILGSQMRWDIVNKFMYIKDCSYHVSHVSYELLSRKYNYAVRMHRLMNDTNGEAYIMEVKKWIEKDDEPIDIVGVPSIDEITRKIQMLLPQERVITKKRYEEISQAITEVANGIRSTSIDTLNDVLDRFCKGYKFESFSTSTTTDNKKVSETYYELLVNGCFPYKLSDGINSEEGIVHFIKNDDGNHNIDELFSYLFNEKIPEAIIDDLKPSFTGHCISRYEGFEDISFRGKENVKIYHKPNKA